MIMRAERGRKATVRRKTRRRRSKKTEEGDKHLLWGRRRNSLTDNFTLAVYMRFLVAADIDSVHPCLEVEDDSRQRPHQGQYGCFALLVGGMDIFWSRQTLGCHGLYYALVLSALHEGMIT